MIACFGGGKGLTATLKALDFAGADFFAVVSTLDNGGSTGILRKKYNIPAIGDFRRVVDHLSKNPIAMSLEARQEGHAIGNLVLVDMIHKFGFERGLEAYKSALGVNREILPLYTESAELVARINGEKVVGEVEIDNTPGLLESLWVEPKLELNPRVLELLDDTEIAVFGPGSLYTSILVHFTSKEIIRALKGKKIIFVSGLKNDLPLVEGFKLSDYLREFERFLKPDFIIAQKPEIDISIDLEDSRLIAKDFSLDGTFHDFKKLGEVLW